MPVPFVIRKGLDIPLEGSPERETVSLPEPDVVALCPSEFDSIRPRLLVREGDRVLRGTALMEDKATPDFRLVAPAAGRIRTIRRGARRSLLAVEIERDGTEDAESFGAVPGGSVRNLPRDEVVQRLLRSGYWGLIRQRPFGGIADPEVTPDSIFVNGMSTAPFRANAHEVVRGAEEEFQAGLDALSALTPGAVHLCLDADEPRPSPALTEAKNVRVHLFRGPPPADATSVHIHHIDPVRGERRVWTVAGPDVILIGHLLLHGTLPTHRTVAVGGPGVRPKERRYYRTRIGTPIRGVTDGRLESGDMRVIGGDVLSGTARETDGFLYLGDSAVTVVPEDRERHMLGWLAPGIRSFSASRTFLSTWLPRRRPWALGTNRHGSRRAMVLTGVYDSVMPMRIRVDFLVRAVLAREFDEAIRLGLLEVVPEDFALCAFICTSKVEIPEIIRQGLCELQAEEA